MEAPYAIVDDALYTILKGVDKKMNEKQRTEDSRGAALWYITEYLETRLKFRRNDFMEWFSMEDGGKSEKTLRRYIKGDSPMKKWTFEQFWNIVEGTVRQYLEYEDMGKPLVPHAAEIWEQEKTKQEEICRCYFLDLNAPERSEDFPESAQRLYERTDQNKKALLDTIKPIFKALDEGTAYSLQQNFPALASVTADDCVFIAHIMTRTEEEKKGLKAAMLQGATVDAGTMLACLQSEEVRCWSNLKNQDYTDTARKSKALWERFSDKLMALMPWQYAAVSLLIETILLLALDKGDPEAKGIEVKLPTADDIELLLLFKYCLAPDEREQYMES